MRVPRANRVLLPLPQLSIPTRVSSWDEVPWHRIITILGSEPDKTASYSKLLELMGAKGDAQRARTVRRALSLLILGSIEGAPSVKRVRHGVYQLEE